MLVQKLRIYAMLMRFQEIEKERLFYLELQKKRMEVFEKQPIPITSNPNLEPLVSLYDKKGKLFEPPKSKYHR